MANNYLEFSEVLAVLTEPEAAWLKEQLQSIHVFRDQEYPEDAVPVELAGTKPDWSGNRFLRDKTDYDPEWDDTLGFEYEFCDDDGEEDWGSHLWFYTEETGDVDQVAWLVQKFLKRFRPDQCWSLTYATTCSKPRVGEFGGGAVFVTARTISWQNTHEFIERKKKAFDAKKHQSSRKKAKP